MEAWAEKVGPEFRVNTHTENIQSTSSVAALADGGFVVTWQSYGQDGSGWGLYGQRYQANGTPLGNEFRVNTTTAGSQLWPCQTALADGGFVVTWHSHGQDGSKIGVYGQRYRANGTPRGNEFRVNTTTAGSQYYPSVAALADGGFVVTWQSYLQVYGQRYRANGTPRGNEFRVNTTTADAQRDASVAALADGGFVVSWDSLLQDGSGWGVYGQRYRANGTPHGKEFRVNTTTASDQRFTSVAALADGGFVVTWASKFQDGSSWGIYSQRYRANGTRRGNELRVNTTTADAQRDASIAALADGGFVVIWDSFLQDGSNYGMYGQRFSVPDEGVGRGTGLR
jgi:hypothetical protein